MSDFEKFKEKLPNKERFYSSLTSKKISEKEYMFLRIGTNLKENDEKLSKFVMKMWHFTYKKFRNNSLKIY